MQSKELPQKLKDYLDTVRTNRSIGDGGRQSLSCPIPCHPEIKKALSEINVKPNRDPSRTWAETPLEETPIENREFRYIEVKTGKEIGSKDALEIIKKQTIFAVVTLGVITEEAKELLRAAGIVYMESVSRSEVKSLRKYNVFDFLTRLKKVFTM